MIKALKFSAKLAVFILGLCVSLWISMPWGKIGEYAVTMAQKTATAKGFNMQHSTVTGSWVGPSIQINDISAKMIFGGAGFKNLEISPVILSSLMNFSPVMHVSFKGGELAMPGGVSASLGSGSFELSESNGIISVSNMKSDGELALDGFMTIDAAAQKIDRADMNIKAPAALNNSFSSMKNFLPLIEEAPGQWKLKREKGNA